MAEVALLDAVDEGAVREHADAVATQSGGIDVALNAIGIPHVQGIPFAELSLDDYLHPITAYCRTNFVTAQAVARHMVAQDSGVILTISTSGSRLAVPGTVNYSTACAAIEATTRVLAAEPGPSGVRVVCLLCEMIPEAGKMGSHSRVTFQPWAERLGLTMDEFLAARPTEPCWGGGRPSPTWPRQQPLSPPTGPPPRPGRWSTSPPGPSSTRGLAGP